MNHKPSATTFAIATLVIALPLGACRDWECGYGGPGCSDPIVAGLCENVLVIGQEYRAIFGYGSDTGLSEATLVSVTSNAPDVLEAIPTPGSPDIPQATGPTGRFDLNNGPGNGGITMRPLSTGKAQVTIALKGWDETRTMSFDIVDMANAPADFMAMSAAERFAKCIEVTARVP
jgi:hypothetical protein